MEGGSYMRTSRLKSLLLYAGIGRDEYSTISPMIWKGNIKTLRITICFALILGMVFLIPNLLIRPDYSKPYLILVLAAFSRQTLIYLVSVSLSLLLFFL